VGAPYEDDPFSAGQGVVYIFYGNPDTLIDSEPSQVKISHLAARILFQQIAIGTDHKNGHESIN